MISSLIFTLFSYLTTEELHPSRSHLNSQLQVVTSIDLLFSYDFLEISYSKNFSIFFYQSLSQFHPYNASDHLNPLPSSVSLLSLSTHPSPLQVSFTFTLASFVLWPTEFNQDQLCEWGFGAICLLQPTQWGHNGRQQLSQNLSIANSSAVKGRTPRVPQSPITTQSSAGLG